MIAHARHPGRSAPASAGKSPWGQDSVCQIKFWLMQSKRRIKIQTMQPAAKTAAALTPTGGNLEVWGGAVSIGVLEANGVIGIALAR
jgi:hypothetical protein